MIEGCEKYFEGCDCIWCHRADKEIMRISRVEKRKQLAITQLPETIYPEDFTSGKFTKIIRLVVTPIMNQIWR
jgi:hypothetical protein